MMGMNYFQTEPNDEFLGGAVSTKELCEWIRSTGAELPPTAGIVIFDLPALLQSLATKQFHRTWWVANDIFGEGFEWRVSAAVIAGRVRAPRPWAPLTVCFTSSTGRLNITAHL
jgi:hypothetical protein